MGQGGKQEKLEPQTGQDSRLIIDDVMANEPLTASHSSGM